MGARRHTFRFRVLFAGLSLCVALLGCQLPLAVPRAISGIQATVLPSPTVPASNPAQIPTATVAQVQSSIVMTVKEVHEESAQPGYTIDARWPFLEWGDDPRAAAFNQSVEAFAASEIQRFRENVLAQPNDPNLNGYSSSIGINFIQTHESSGILAVLYKVSLYVAGAAHPAQFTSSINFDLNQGRVIELSDLFQPGADYLSLLSSLCISDLKSRDALVWETGALPRVENFQVWNITPDGLLITFDNYTVAPYAMGPQAVMIAYSSLNGIARTDGPLAPYLTH